ncbi:cytochrome c-type biogenesis protein CcmH [Myxococcota bacterium]|nr:cytochrome c-type biogenesis protein CcmH [Myxococcota bacterium]
MRQARWRGWACGWLLLLAVGVSGSAASAEPSEGWSYALWQEMMSPFCPGRTLADCTSGHAESLRMWILVQESAGRTREDVEEELYERYGDVILAAPRAEGFGLTAYVVPVLLFGAGGLGILFLLRRFTSPLSAASPDTRESVVTEPSPGDAELESRVDEEMRSR